LSDDNEKKDLTRIENLAEFLHDEDEDFSDLETYDPDSAGAPEEDNDNFSEFADQATDPNIDASALNNEATAADLDNPFAADGPPDSPFPFESDEEPNEFAANDDSSFSDGDDSFGNDDASFTEGDDSFASDDDSFNSEDNSFENSEENSFDSDESSFESDDSAFDSEDDNFDSDDNSFDSEASSFNSEDSSFDSEDSSFDSEDSSFDSEDSSFDSEDSSFDSEDSSFDSEDSSFDSNQELQDDNELSPAETTTDIQDNFPSDEDLEEPEMPPVPTDEVNDNTIFAASGPETVTEPEISDPVPETTFGDTSKTLLDNEVVAEGDYQPPENFKDLQKFSQSMSLGNLAAEGNPPFSVIIKDVRYEEDVEDIMILLKEFQLVTEDSESSTREALERGSALIPRISEYAAIILCHKLRRFNVNLLMGLADEVHPSKSYSGQDHGLVSKQSVYNNQNHNFDLKNRVIQLSDIITSTTPSLDGHDIVQYLGVVTERSIIDMAHFAKDQSLESELIGAISEPQRSHIIDQKVTGQNQAAASSTLFDQDSLNESANDETNDIPRASLSDIYQSLVDKLKAHALKFQGNAVIGINFVVTPILVDDSMSVHSKYQITCTGSVVWVNRR
jgi:uncharacterized protein YbjQ (UPF0145 family)